VVRPVELVVSDVSLSAFEPATVKDTGAVVAVGVIVSVPIVCAPTPTVAEPVFTVTFSNPVLVILAPLRVFRPPETTPRLLIASESVRPVPVDVTVIAASVEAPVDEELPALRANEVAAD